MNPKHSRVSCTAHFGSARIVRRNLQIAKQRTRPVTLFPDAFRSPAYHKLQSICLQLRPACLQSSTCPLIALSGSFDSRIVFLFKLSWITQLCARGIWVNKAVGTRNSSECNCSRVNFVICFNVPELRVLMTLPTYVINYRCNE